MNFPVDYDTFPFLISELQQQNSHGLYKIIPLVLSLTDSIRGLPQATCLGLLYQILPSLNSIF